LIAGGSGATSATRAFSRSIELAKVVTPENVAEVLPRFFGLSSRDAAAVAVSIRPIEHPPVREVVTPLRSTAPAPVALPQSASAPAAPHVGDEAAHHGPPLQLRAPELELANAPTPDAAAPPPRSCASTEPRPTADPLDGDRARLHITVSRRLLAKLEAAKAALSHSHPGAGSEEVLEAALDLLLAQRAKRRGIVEKPRNAAAPGNPETIPAAVKREVWNRAGGRCECRLESGGICGSTLRLEFDHVTPRALGGPSTIDNLRVACRFHNQLAARRTFGDEWMERFTRGRSGGPGTQRGSEPARPSRTASSGRARIQHPSASAGRCDES
jgi:hypothetical protein